MDAIITAGSVSLPDNPLYQVTGFAKKALIPLAGRPMVAWVVDAVWQSGLVDRLVIVGLRPHEAHFGSAPVEFVDTTGDLIGNILAGIDRLRQLNPSLKKVLLVSCDIPLITPQIVRGFVEECSAPEADGYYPVVEKKVMESRFPGSKRTFVPLKGGRYSGGDMFLLDATAVPKIDLNLIRLLAGSRKDYWRQVRMLGFGFMARFLLRQMTVYETAVRIGKMVNVNACAVATRFAELGMDVDKPHQYELVKAILEQQR